MVRPAARRARTRPLDACAVTHAHREGVGVVLPLPPEDRTRTFGQAPSGGAAAGGSSLVFFRPEGDTRVCLGRVKTAEAD